MSLRQDFTDHGSYIYIPVDCQITNLFVPMEFPIKVYIVKSGCSIL